MKWPFFQSTPANIAFHELTDLDNSHGREATEIYIQSFPEEERDPISAIAANVRTSVTDEAVHHFRIMTDSDRVIGIAIFASFRAYWMGYLKFIAIRQDIRSNGYGSFLLRNVVQQVRHDGIRQTGWPYMGVVLEVERPEDAADDAQRALREKRIHFYQRNGARLLADVDFVAPPITPEQPPLPFHLMVRPTMPKFMNGAQLRRMMIESVLLSGYGEEPDSWFVRHALAASSGT